MFNNQMLFERNMKVKMDAAGGKESKMALPSKFTLL